MSDGRDPAMLDHERAQDYERAGNLPKAAEFYRKAAQGMAATNSRAEIVLLEKAASCEAGVGPMGLNKSVPAADGWSGEDVA